MNNNITMSGHEIATKYTARAMHVSLVLFALDALDVRAIVCPSRRAAQLLLMIHNLDLECAVPGTGNWWELLEGDTDDVSMKTFLERLEAREAALKPEVRPDLYLTST